MGNYGKPNVWTGGAGTGDELDIEPTGYTSPRLSPTKRKRRKPANGAQDVIKTYFADRGYGFTRDGIYFNGADVIEGDPVIGAVIQYVTVDAPRGVRAKNVYITN